MDANTTNTATAFNGSDGDQAHVGGLAVHSQVIKIKEEIERIKHPSLQLQIMMRLRDVKRLRSRSPLGLAERAILLGHS